MLIWCMNSFNFCFARVITAQFFWRHFDNLDFTHICHKLGSAWPAFGRQSLVHLSQVHFSRLASRRSKTEKSFEYSKRGKIHWIRKVSRNRGNDQIPWKVIISRDLVVSHVYRHFPFSKMSGNRRNYRIPWKNHFPEVMISDRAER